jgi:hypothetical protein
MIAIVHRKKQQDEWFKPYEAKLEANANDRTTLTILESAVQQLKFDLPRLAEYMRRLIELDVEEGKAPDPEMRCQIAFTLRLSHKEVESADMYQSLADSEKFVTRIVWPKLPNRGNELANPRNRLPQRNRPRS